MFRKLRRICFMYILCYFSIYFTVDCWDGLDGEPIIYHGHTLTSQIKFHDVITATRDHAFDVSPYPVILSLENHCSESYQQKMAYHIVEILKDMVLLILYIKFTHC